MKSVSQLETENAARKTTLQSVGSTAAPPLSQREWGGERENAFHNERCKTEPVSR